MKNEDSENATEGTLPVTGEPKDDEGPEGGSESPAPSVGDAKKKARFPARRKRVRDLSRKRKLAYVLSQEVRRIVDDLAIRKWLLMEIWTKMRIREPFINVLRSRFELIKPDDLLMLSVEGLDLLDKFYRTLDDFGLYLQSTEDMPTALDIAYERYSLLLTRISVPLLEVLDELHGYKTVFPLILPRGGEILDDE